MKALTIRQPWAHLIVVGAKRYETRTWRPPAARIGERIAIHAGKAAPAPLRARFDRLLPGGGLPLGVIVATARVAGIRDIDEAFASRLFVYDRDEYEAGDYTAGRVAWELADVEPLAEPLPVVGRLGLWDVPAGVLGEETARA